MNKYQPRFIDIQTLEDARKQIIAIGSDPDSINIMAPKTVHRNIVLHNISVQDAIIIKQDMLSIGGEVALPKDAFYLNKELVTILISGTILQHQTLITKLNRHYPRIQRIAQELSKLIESSK
jgi:dihydropteroate synthase